jgi:hypothetical protein
MDKENDFDMTVGDITINTFFYGKITQNDIDDWEVIKQAFEKFLSRYKS